MASYGVIQSALNGLPAAIRSALTAAFSELAHRLALTPTDNGVKSANFSAWRFDATTSSVVDGEFVITHGQGQTPKALLPVLPLQSSSYQLVALAQTRAADSQRIYLRSPSTGALISVLVEF